MSDATAVHISSTNNRLRSLELIVLGWTKATAVGLVMVGALIPFVMAPAEDESEAVYSLLTAAYAVVSAEGHWLASPEVIHGHHVTGFVVLVLLLCAVVGAFTIIGMSAITTSSRMITCARIGSTAALLSTGALWGMLTPLTAAFADDRQQYSFLGPSSMTIGVIVAVAAAYSPSYAEMG